ncbi:unnamed protein product [Effrenium voratum]|nr:unnamed protein product [Effrenium voratum]
MDPEAATQELRAGRRARLVGLAAAEFNGRKGRLLRLDKTVDPPRWLLRLDGDGARVTHRILPEKLQPCGQAGEFRSFGGPKLRTSTGKIEGNHFWLALEKDPASFSEPGSVSLSTAPNFAWDRRAMSLSVTTASGEEVLVPYEPEDTFKAIKEKLQTLLGSPAGAMRLIQTTQILDDAMKVADVAAGGLTLVIAALPCGDFVLKADGALGGGPAPAGENTWADVEVKICSDGSASVVIEESEITSDDEDDDYDPYANHAAWHHEYHGVLRVVAEGRFALVVQRVERKGIFPPKVSSEPAELRGECDDAASKLRLELPFAAGGCNDGTKGYAWVSLNRSTEEEKPAPEALLSL